MVVRPFGYGSLRGLLSLRAAAAPTAGKLSVAVAGVMTTVASHLPASVSCTMAAGQVMLGFSLSLIVTVGGEPCRVRVEFSAVAVSLKKKLGYGSLKGLLSLRTPATPTPGQLSLAVAAVIAT